MHGSIVIETHWKTVRKVEILEPYKLIIFLPVLLPT